MFISILQEMNIGLQFISLIQFLLYYELHKEEENSLEEQWITNNVITHLDDPTIWLRKFILTPYLFLPMEKMRLLIWKIIELDQVAQLLY